MDSPVATIDIGPTLFDFAGITPSYEMDGISWRNAIDSLTFESYLTDDRCLFFELYKDRAVRCGCNKYLNLYSQDDPLSTTYKRGLRFGYSIDLDYVYDFCGGGNEYITDPATNMEETNLYTWDNDRTLFFRTCWIVT